MYKTGANPYSRGWAKNIFGRFCGPFRSRYIKMHLTEMEDICNPPAATRHDDPRDYEMALQFEEMQVELT